MYDLNVQNPELSKEEVLSRISEYQIFCYYIGTDVKMKSLMPSPLRRNDNNPSFSVFTGRLGSMLYHDFGTGETGDCFSFVGKMFGLNFYQVLCRINIDFNLKLSMSRDVDMTPMEGYIANSLPSKETVKADLGISFKEFDYSELQYWAKYGISKKMLDFYNVKSIRTVFLGSSVFTVSYKGNPIFAYMFYKDFTVMYKIYRPYARKTDIKWLSNTNKTVLQGWTQLPRTGKVLIITKSLKDVMVLRTLGLYAISMQTERSRIKDTVMDEMFYRFDHIYVLQDFDLAGVSGTNRLRKMFPKLKYFFLQSFKTRGNGFKDISDFRAKHSLEETKKQIPDEIWELLKEN